MYKSLNEKFKNLVEEVKRNDALNIVFKYGLFGVIWIVLSDDILEIFADNFVIYKTLQTYKGWLFVFISMVIAYILLHKREVKIKKATSETQKMLKELKYIAYYDTLTGLPNRAMFVNKIKNLAQNYKGSFAIAVIDIDNFKYINDTLGHFVGDDFLKHIGEKLSQVVSFPNLVARIGGDEYAILFREYGSEEELLMKLDAIKASIGTSWNAGVREYFISASIGVSIFPYNGEKHEALLKNADIALYMAKKDGKNKIVFYEEDLNEEVLQHVKMANRIQKGLDNDEFELFYQPQIDMVSGKIRGLEALVRWRTDEVISPAKFIPVAEITGQIYELERHIVRKVLDQKKKWEELGLKDIEISINLSSKSLISSTDFKLLDDIFTEFGLDYSNIVIEITETAAISNIDLAIERLNVLRRKGHKIALDDFGTGYSSITYLLMLPIDIIKLDKSYISSKYGDQNDKSIAKFIVSLAHFLGYKVCAEGIETSQQLEHLKSIGCEYGQGYYIGKPMCVDDINNILFNDKIA
jgi:diguanylate cyclase (GGDEF)-like protein